MLVCYVGVKCEETVERAGPLLDREPEAVPPVDAMTASFATDRVSCKDLLHSTGCVHGTPDRKSYRMRLPTFTHKARSPSDGCAQLS